MAVPPEIDVRRFTDTTTQPDPRIVAALAQYGHDVPWRRKPVQRFVKRVMDMFGALVLGVLLAPIMLLIAILVRATSRGPIFFLQTRIGLGGMPFRMIKFRSMVAELPDGSAKGRGEVTADDQRLTPIGSWLRAWRLDELPQLVHVISGKMSLVGPRPDIPPNLDLYSPEQMLRFAMPPGCTAWAFTRGAFRNDWLARQDINVEYIQQWSLWLDMVILLQTVVVLLHQKDTTPETREQIRSKQ